MKKILFILTVLLTTCLFSIGTNVPTLTFTNTKTPKLIITDPMNNPRITFKFLKGGPPLVKSGIGPFEITMSDLASIHIQFHTQGKTRYKDIYNVVKGKNYIIDLSDITAKK